MPTASWRLIANALKQRVVDVTAGVAEKHTVILGWPSRNQLNEGLQSGRTFISVFKPAGMERRVNGFISHWCPVPNPVPRDLLLDGTTTCELNFRLTSTDVAFFTLQSTSGTPVPGETVAIIIKRYGAYIPDLVAGHRVAEGDTVLSIANALIDGVNALAVPNLVAVMASSSSTSASIRLEFSPGPDDERQVEDVAVRAAAVRTLMRETSRMQSTFWVNVWAPSPDTRDLFVGLLEGDFASFPGSSAGQSRLPLANGTSIYMLPSGGWPSDEEQPQKNWRYTLTLGGEYGVYETDTSAGTILDTLLTYTILQPPGTTSGPGGQLQEDCIVCIDCIDPWIADKLNALTIFATPDACN
jgi:hypothetical protein